MEVKYFRGSSLNTYDDCKFKYFLTYDVGLPSKAGKKAACGSSIHLSLETIANNKRDNKPQPSLDQLIRECYETQKRLEPWHDWTEADYRFCHKQVMNVVNSEYNPANLDILDTEVQFEVVLAKPPFNGNLLLRGTVDLLTLDCNNKDTLLITDYKSGSINDWGTGLEKTLDSYVDDNQFSTYDLVLANLFPQYKNRIFTVLFTQKMQPFTFAYTDQQRKDSLERLRRYWYEIFENNNPIRLKDDPLRTGEKFKCVNVCSFGRDQRCLYQSLNTGKMIEHIIDKKHVVTTFEDNDDVWELQHQESLCDYYNNIRTGKSLVKAKELIQISVNGQEAALSKRNDYSNPKILRGVIN